MADFADLARQKAIEIALAYPQYFVARYFADTRKGILGQEDFQAEWWNTADRENRLLLLAPRAHAKTTNMGIWYPIYRLCKWRWAKQRGLLHDSDPRIGLLSNTEGQAEGLCRAITENLERNEKLIADFGSWKPDPVRKWTTLELIVSDWSAPNSKDVTIFAGGTGSAWLGRRVDLLIADDVADLKLNSSTEEARLKLLEWWRGVVTNLLESDRSQIIVTGTMQHHQDLYNTLIYEEIARKREQRRPVWTIRKYRAIIHESSTGTADGNDAGGGSEVLWPAQRPYEYLLQRKSEIGSAAFEKQFQNVAVNEELLCFKPEFLRGRCLDRSAVVGPHGVGDGWRLFVGVDPAVGASGLAKFFVMVVVGLDQEGKLHLVDVFRDKLSVPKQLSWLKTWWDIYWNKGLVCISIETNAYQEALKQILVQQFPTIRVRPHFTAKNKVDPEVGVVSTCAPLVENGLLRIPYGNPESIRKMDKFIDELSIWPEGPYTDQVMALWIAVTAAREGVFRHKSKPGIWGTSVKNPIYDTDKSLKLSDEEIEELELQRELHARSALRPNPPLPAPISEGGSSIRIPRWSKSQWAITASS